MSYSIKIERLDDHMHFRASNDAGNSVDMDNGPNGASPMQLLIMAMGGCSGIDIVDMLKKSRQSITSFQMELDATREKKGTWSEFTAIQAHYILEGELDRNKVERAVRLSLNKYCSVSKALEHTATITASYSINGEQFEVELKAK